MECTRTYCALSVFPSGRASFEFTGGTCSDRSQMIRDDSKPSWLNPSERLPERWEHSTSSHSPPSAVLEEPLQRAGQGPVQALGPAQLVPPALGPHLKLSGRPLSGTVPAVLLGSQLKIAHQFIIEACQQHLCCIGTSLNFGIRFRVTQRDR